MTTTRELCRAMNAALQVPGVERHAARLVRDGWLSRAGTLPCADNDRALMPGNVVDAVAGLSFLTHFHSLSKGVLDLRDIVYFLLVIGAWLYANTIVLNLKKAE